uniref:Bladder cancer associated protein n=1 Tax=Cyprinus carpio carpio TaxID=630221 RepID=A0A9J8AAL1_CYPCA
MYCLQWLLPVLLIPKPLNPALWFNHSMFMGFYLLSFLLERKPCTICALVFLAALFLICYSCWGNCFLYHCHDSSLPDSAPRVSARTHPDWECWEVLVLYTHVDNRSPL